MTPSEAGPSACVVCATPFTGPWGFFFYLTGIRRSAGNPGVCSRCNQHIVDGALTEVTVIFVDLSGFTAMTNELGAQRAHEIVEAFLKMASGLLIAHDAAIDKFIGDAVMAFFNAPIKREDHPRRALEAAQAILDAMESLSRRFGRPLTAQIGVASGWARIGRLAGGEVTAIGAPVNLAARLEAEALPGEIVAEAAACRRAAADAAGARDETLRLKGFHEPVAVRRWGARERHAQPQSATENSPVDSAGLSFGAAVFAVLGAPCAATTLLGPLVVPLGVGSALAATGAAGFLDQPVVRGALMTPAVIGTLANLYALARARALRRGLPATPLESARGLWVVATAFLVAAALVAESWIHARMSA